MQYLYNIYQIHTYLVIYYNIRFIYDLHYLQDTYIFGDGCFNNNQILLLLLLFAIFIHYLQDTYRYADLL